MIEVKDKRQCCGCTACEEICPVDCIEMESDEEGFMYPIVDVEKCVGCGACERVCPELNYKRHVSFTESAYLVQNKDETVLKDSTSGGAFTAIAQYVINKGGIVYGAVMDPDTFFVHHEGIENEKELYKFRNSKYVQSGIGSCYKEALSWLQRGRFVCFSGTPCQIEGFIVFLGNKINIHRNKLLLVDVVCRAVPSPGVWEKYVTDIEKKHGKIEKVRFRDKKLGYQYSTMLIKTEDGEIQRDGIETSLWLRMFFSGMIIRPSCTECKFRSPYRKSDITLWDCFPTYRFDKRIDEDAGTTRVLVHSEKGVAAFKSIKDDFYTKQVKVKDAVSSVREMRLSPKWNAQRNEFFATMKSDGLVTAEKQFFPITKKVMAKRCARQFLHKIGLDKKVKHLLKKG